MYNALSTAAALQVSGFSRLEHSRRFKKNSLVHYFGLFFIVFFFLFWFTTSFYIEIVYILRLFTFENRLDLKIVWL
jgi:hypothetical protein